MAKATQNNSYLDLAESFYEEFSQNYNPGHFSWDNKVAGAQILLYALTWNDKYLEAVDTFIDYLLYEAPRTPKGMIYLTDWGSAPAAINVAHAALQAKKNFDDNITIQTNKLPHLGRSLGSSEWRSGRIGSEPNWLCLGWHWL